MQVLGLVTARGGSKGIPRKNIRPLLGRPLLAHTAEAALGARRLNRVILSTDDLEIAEVGRQWGLAVPFLRPPELARDDTPSLSVVRHAVLELEAAGERFDAVCLLQPTSPLRQSSHIDGAIDLLEASGADAVVSVVAVPEAYNPHWVYWRLPDGSLRLSTGEANPIPRRQELPPAFHRDGSLYVTRRDVLIEGNSLYGTRVAGYVTDARDAINIDTPADWDRAVERMTALA